MTKQQQIKVRGGTLTHKALPPMMPIIPSNLVTFILIKKIYKTLFKDTFEKLVNNMKKLKVEMSDLKKNQRAIFFMH